MIIISQEIFGRRRRCLRRIVSYWAVWQMGRLWIGLSYAVQYDVQTCLYFTDFYSYHKYQRYHKWYQLNRKSWKYPMSVRVYKGILVYFMILKCQKLELSPATMDLAKCLSPAWLIWHWGNHDCPSGSVGQTRWSLSGVDRFQTTAWYDSRAWPTV